MTRGLLSRVPALYGSGPALITETECSARGGRYCLYALSWEEPADRMVGRTRTPGRRPLGPRRPVDPGPSDAGSDDGRSDGPGPPRPGVRRSSPRRVTAELPGASSTGCAS